VSLPTNWISLPPTSISRKPTYSTEKTWRRSGSLKVAGNQSSNPNLHTHAKGPRSNHQGKSGLYGHIDNDHWVLLKAEPPDFESWDEEQQSKWSDSCELVSAGEVINLGDGGWGSGCCYGGDILQALAIIVGINIQSV
jgi:hypothetical protein